MHTAHCSLGLHLLWTHFCTLKRANHVSSDSGLVSVQLLMWQTHSNAIREGWFLHERACQKRLGKMHEGWGHPFVFMGLFKTSESSKMTGLFSNPLIRKLAWGLLMGHYYLLWMPRTFIHSRSILIRQKSYSWEIKLSSKHGFSSLLIIPFLFFPFPFQKLFWAEWSPLEF